MVGQVRPEILERLRAAVEDSRGHVDDCDCIWCDVRRNASGIFG